MCIRDRVQVLARDVSRHFEEDLEDRFALLGVLELMIFEIAGKRAVLDLVRHRSDGNRRARGRQIGCAYGACASPIKRSRFLRAAALSQSSATARSKARIASLRRPEAR